MVNKEYLDKRWSKYELGNISWAKEIHPSKKMFVDSVLHHKDDIKSILEIGPAEMVEYQMLQNLTKIDYTILDISTLFIENCKVKFPEVKTIHGMMEEPIDGNFDLVYLASVLEHCYNVKAAIKNLVTSAKYFYFVMFKWSWKGDLISKKQISQTTKMEYFSTCFDVWDILNEISKYGKIESYNVCHYKTGKLTPLEKFQKIAIKQHNGLKNRTGDYLIIKGKSHGMS